MYSNNLKIELVICFILEFVLSIGVPTLTITIPESCKFQACLDLECKFTSVYCISHAFSGPHLVSFNDLVRTLLFIVYNVFIVILRIVLIYHACACACTRVCAHTHTHTHLLILSKQSVLSLLSLLISFSLSFFSPTFPGLDMFWVALSELCIINMFGLRLHDNFCHCSFIV